MKYLWSIILLLSINYSVCSQTELYGIGTSWDDSYKEWEVYTADEDIEGELELRWTSGDNWKEWDYRIEDESGSIKQKWHNDASQWELRGGNEIITMKTKWSGDITEWRISTGSITLTLESKYKSSLQEWELTNGGYGKFQMYTSYENDPRDWEIVDELNEEISLHTKMALVFIVMYNSSPKL